MSFENHTQAIYFALLLDEDFSTVASARDNISRGHNQVRSGSPLAVTLVVLVTSLLSPVILIGNSLVLAALWRFKRLRTPSNCLVASLASSDLGFGLFMPAAVYVELGGPRNSDLCLLTYGLSGALCCCSLLLMVAIAVDRFTSLARPLRYSNLITHSTVERYVIVFWMYSFAVGFTPYIYSYVYNIGQRNDCSFSELVTGPVRLFLFCAVYGPGAVVLLLCYGYVYFVARGHARAISQQARQTSNPANTTHSAPRYGCTLALTAGLFVLLWTPFQAGMLSDAVMGTELLQNRQAVHLMAFPIALSSACNPWLYGYRNAELRTGIKCVLEDTLYGLGLANHGPSRITRHIPDPTSAAATAGAGTSPRRPELQLLMLLPVPIALPESSAILSESEGKPRLTPSLVVHIRENGGHGTRV